MPMRPTHTRSPFPRLIVTKSSGLERREREREKKEDTPKGRGKETRLMKVTRAPAHLTVSMCVKMKKESARRNGKHGQQKSQAQ